MGLLDDDELAHVRNREIGFVLIDSHIIAAFQANKINSGILSMH